MEQPKVIPQKRARKYGVDILKMLSMFMVTILHTQGYGGILDATKPGLNKHVVNIIEISAYCAVDIFGMVSGYLIINSKKVNIFKFIPLWLTVVFYTFIITLLFKFVPYFSKYREITINDIIKAFTPVYSRTYWYVTSYFGLYVFIPYLNELLHSLGQKRHKHLIILIISIFSVIPFIVIGKQNDNFTINNGYSQWWLGCLYVIGAYFKLYPFKVNKLLLVGIYILSVVIVWVCIFYQKYFQFLKYESLFILLSGISIFLFFIQVEIKNKYIQKILELGSSVSFSVYVIHFNPLLTPVYLKGRTAPYHNDPTYSVILRVFLTAGAIYVICSFIDLFRYYLFKYLYVNKLPGILEGYYNKLIKKFEDRNKKDSDEKGAINDSESTENIICKKNSNDSVVNMDNTENTDPTFQELNINIEIPPKDNASFETSQKFNTEIIYQDNTSEAGLIIDPESKKES